MEPSRIEDRSPVARTRPARFAWIAGGLALTGLDHGPDLAGLLPLIGRERALARLGGETA